MKEIIIDGVEYILTPKKEEDIILVPDNIKLSKLAGYIAIHNGRHHLYYASGFGSWVVGNNNDGDELIKCKLVRYEWEEIKVGDVFYRDDKSNPDFDNLIGYAIKLDDKNFQFWDGKDCNYHRSGCNYYWKVVQI